METWGLGVQGGTVRFPTFTPCLFVKKVQLLKPHNVYVKTVHDLHGFRGPLVEKPQAKGVPRKIRYQKKTLDP